jgi:hypothetical protein
LPKIGKQLKYFSSANWCNGDWETLNAEDELITKLKQDMGNKMHPMFAGIARDMMEKNKDVIIKWLKDNKDLVKEVIGS